MSETVETNGNGWAQEAQGTFVKSSNGSGERKNIYVTIWEITKILTFN
jgi:hypothetical protein